MYYMFLGAHCRRPEGRGKELVLFRMLIRVHLIYYALYPRVIEQVRLGEQLSSLGRGAVYVFERLDGCERQLVGRDPYYIACAVDCFR